MRRLLVQFMLVAATTIPIQHPKTDARAFVLGIYAQYKDAGAPSGPKDSNVYSPELLSLMAADRKKAGKGYVGAIDFDQLCQCQDWDGLTVADLKLVSRTATKMDADVVLKVSKTDSKLTHLRLVLLRTPKGWRVDDVQPAGSLSTLDLLRRAKD